MFKLAILIIKKCRFTVTKEIFETVSNFGSYKEFKNLKEVKFRRPAGLVKKVKF